MPRVYILGAGASCFAGYPLAPKLWSFTRDRSSGDVIAKQRRQDVVAAMERIIERFPPAVYDEPNLEELFTILDLSILIPNVFELRHIDWKVTRLKVAGMIVEAFVNYQWDLQGLVYAGKPPVEEVGVDPRHARRVLDAWALRVRPGDVIISFNWDLLHEVALWRAVRWSYRDGYGFICRDGLSAPQSAVTVLKLHGSVNWTQDEHDDADPEVVHKQDFFPGALDGPDAYRKEGGQWDQGRKLIIPTYLKTVSQNAILARLWAKAGDALTHADEVIVIGYRLHNADGAAHQLFTSSLLANPARPQVEVVSPGGRSDDNWDDLCAIIGYPPPKRTRKPFESWVLEGASP
jgi:hypothetical protein